MKSSRKQNMSLLLSGYFIFVISMLLGFYSNGMQHGIPNFPFLDLKFPLIGILTIVSALIVSFGWLTRSVNGGFLPVLLTGVVYMALFALLLELSLRIGVVQINGGVTTPYSTQAFIPFISAAYVVIFGIIISLALKHQKKAEGRKASQWP